VWSQYSSLDLWKRAPDPDLKEVMKGGGRGYYRPPSLLAVWAYAPFMGNNGIGPEVCGKPADARNDFYSSPYVDANDRLLANPPPCVPFDPSVEGRYRLFKASMEDLLNPARRLRKVNLADRDIVVDIASKVKLGPVEFSPFSVVLPKGSPVILINSLRYKDLIQDLVLIERNRPKLDAKYKTILTPQRYAEMIAGLERLDLRISGSAGGFKLNLASDEPNFIQTFYSNVLGRVENTGHPFGESLSDGEKKALIAFLATL
jgi:hypothetical protein